MTELIPGRVVGIAIFVLFLTGFSTSGAFAQDPLAPRDPGVRGGPSGTGEPIAGLNDQQLSFFNLAKDAFSEVDGVAEGLGPRFNLDSCAGCHAQPEVGGSSPPKNPQIAVAMYAGARNAIPPFITQDGPVREARFPSDGAVHDLFTIAGRSDAQGCNIAQPDFATELNRNNVIFRIPTPVFGAGFIEATPDEYLIANAAAVDDRRKALQIAGGFNHQKKTQDAFQNNPNDGTISRFGWKAQNKSLLLFAGEAYNVEQGVTNELFPSERQGDPSCQYTTHPEDHTDIGSTSLAALSDIVLFAKFMGLLAAPVPAPPTASTMAGQQAFVKAGCDVCHIPRHTTGPSNLSALNYAAYFPYSDFQVHDMGKGLADGITQGEASGSEFRTAPLWGLGQRIFFLHDGRTTDLLQAILAHDSPQSEASRSVSAFNSLSAAEKQNLLNFLRSL
jgi:CxxC motif-containing protein (DUF1111 family)